MHEHRLFIDYLLITRLFETLNTYGVWNINMTGGDGNLALWWWKLKSTQFIGIPSIWFSDSKSVLKFHYRDSLNS